MLSKMDAIFILRRQARMRTTHRTSLAAYRYVHTRSVHYLDTTDHLQRDGLSQRSSASLINTLEGDEELTVKITPLLVSGFWSLCRLLADYYFLLLLSDLQISYQERPIIVSKSRKRFRDRASAETYFCATRHNCTVANIFVSKNQIEGSCGEFQFLKPHKSHNNKSGDCFINP